MHTFVSATEMVWAIKSEHSLSMAQSKITHSVTILVRAGNLVLKQESVVKENVY
jgi:hypothetical protein